MRLLLYNIRYGTGHKKGFHLPVPYAGFFKNTAANLQRIISFIRIIDPDIIGLIEVDSGSYRTSNACQAAQIARELGYHFIVETKYSNSSIVHRMPIIRQQSNALLSRSEILDCSFHYFSQGVKRLIIRAELENVAIFVVHLSLKFRHRQNQLSQLYSLIKSTEKEIIVAGDFNTFWGDRELRLFLAATGLESANVYNAPSHPSHAPHREIDYILHSPGITIDDFFIPDIKLSDHAPLVCDFTCRSSCTDSDNIPHSGIRMLTQFPDALHNRR
jgi:endonuclease/exonuclease/phosphatase family metal-dependent hydrolase